MNRKIGNGDDVGQELSLDSPNDTVKAGSKLKRIGRFCKCKDNWFKIACVAGLAIIGGIAIYEKLKNDELSLLNENIMSENNVLTGLFKNVEEKNLLLEAENVTIKKTNENLWKRGASISGRSLKKLRDPEAGSFLYDFQKKSQ